VGARGDQLGRDGVFLCLSADGTYTLTAEMPPHTGCKGTCPRQLLAGKWNATNQWHLLNLTLVDDNIIATVDGIQVIQSTLPTDLNLMGFVSIGATLYGDCNIEFKNIAIAPTKSYSYPSKCGAKAGSQLTLTPCAVHAAGKLNAVTAFDLLTRRIVNSDGLCVTGHNGTNTITLETCTPNNANQFWTYDYSEIRNYGEALYWEGDTSLGLSWDKLQAGGPVILAEKPPGITYDPLSGQFIAGGYLCWASTCGSQA